MNDNEMIRRTPIALKPPRRSMPAMANSRPELLPGEEVVLEAQGGYRERHRTGWRPVECFLTNQRLIFYLRPRIRFQISIERIRKLTDERHYYILKVRDALCITYDAGQGARAGKVLFITGRMAQWKEKIRQLCFLKLDLETIQRVAAQLDADGREILWHLWEYRHARINRLAELIEAPDHMHVLSLITETINPISEKILGCPILSFERKRIDPKTGKTIIFSWWLINRKEGLFPNEARLVDIFDEGAYIRVVMEVRGVEPGDLRLDFDRARVTIRSHKLGASLQERLELPHAVSPAGYTMRLRNNFLELKLRKTMAIDE
jgi:HSP20 family molecular chaperone IbpA